MEHSRSRTLWKVVEHHRKVWNLVESDGMLWNIPEGLSIWFSYRTFQKPCIVYKPCVLVASPQLQSLRISTISSVIQVIDISTSQLNLTYSTHFNPISGLVY